MMELADVLDSKSSGSDTVRVRPPLPAPKRGARMGSPFFGAKEVGGAAPLSMAKGLHTTSRAQGRTPILKKRRRLAAEAFFRSRCATQKRIPAPTKRAPPLELFSKGQFCKNTVYLERGMPYSCFFSPYADLRISSIISRSLFSSGSPKRQRER